MNEITLGRGIGRWRYKSLEQVLTARSPLADCTNIIEARQKIWGGELKTSNKGQWKRTAKQQVIDSRFSDGKTHEEVGLGGLRREIRDELKNPVV